MNKVKVGVLGCAEIAEKLFLPALKTLDEYELCAVASRDQSKSKRFAEKFECSAVSDYTELLNSPEIDLIYIPLPPALHFEWGIKALESGKHIILEKPFVISEKEAVALLRYAREKKLLVFENFMFQYHSQQKYIRNILENNEIGEIRIFKSSFGFPALAPDNFRYQKSLGGGALLDAGVYPLKALQFFLGDDFDIIGSYLQKDHRDNADNLGGALLTNRSGIIAELSFGFNSYYQCNVEFWGTKGKLTASRVFTAPPGFYPTIQIEKQNEIHIYTLSSDNHCIKMLREIFILLQNDQVDYNFDLMLSQMKKIQKIMDSNE